VIIKILRVFLIVLVIFLAVTGITAEIAKFSIISFAIAFVIQWVFAELWIVKTRKNQLIVGLVRTGFIG